MCFVQDPPARLQAQTQFTDAEWEAGRRYSLEFSPRNQARGGGTLCEGQTSWDARWNNNALFVYSVLCLVQSGFHVM